jgi:inhibitor of cysteine peptidase
MPGKKIFLFILFFCVFVFSMGVNMAADETNKNDPDENEPVIFLMSDDAETHITVDGVGEFAIKIKSNPTTGYSWALQKPLDETMLKLKDIAMEEKEEEKPPKLGAPTYEILTFEALQPGETVIYLQYRRPWEKDVAPIKTHKVFVTVT